LQKVVELVFGPRTNRDRSCPGEVFAGEHRFDAGKSERLFSPDARYSGVSVRGSEHPHPQLTDAVDVVDEVAKAAQQAAIFEPAYPLPDGAHWA
jgi:hypothetical protein